MHASTEVLVAECVAVVDEVMGADALRDGAAPAGQVRDAGGGDDIDESVGADNGLGGEAPAGQVRQRRGMARRPKPVVIISAPPSCEEAGKV